MLKITETERTEGKVTLKLEGRIAGELVGEVKTACEKILSDGFHLVLDMADVSFVERGSVAFFSQLQERRVVLINCSWYLSEQMKKGVEDYA